MSKEEEKKGLSRRAFLKNTGLTAAAAATGASLLGPQVVAAQDSDIVLNAELSTHKWSFEVPPDPIPESDISNTVEADIIIIGSGVSGLTAANSAAENGANVTLISASSAPVYRGGSFHAKNSRYMEAQGLEPYDVDKFFRRELSAAGYNVDQDKWYRFYNNSEEAINWLMDKMEAAGYETVIESAPYEPDSGPMWTPAVAHSWCTPEQRRGGMGAEFVVKTLAATAVAAGVDIRYKVIAKQLVREDNNTGRVTAVIAQEENGGYTKYVGTKAVIMAMGDFSANKEMMTKYCAMALPFLSDAGDRGYDNSFKAGGLFPGDGQKMGLWIGAAWQRTFPNPPMINGSFTASTQAYGSHRGLVVNKNGYRFGCEDVNGPFEAHAKMHQPDVTTFAIWPANYAEAAAPWRPITLTYDSDPIPPETILEGWEASVEAGTMVKGDTVEAVIEQLGLPMEATKATIDRYNGFCATGVDEDYHKRPELLVPITEGPFYGANLGKPAFLTVLGGLRTNIKMQVCDENDQPIPGLYNIGTMVGDFFANMYTFRVQGHNLGANCVTFGYLTGRDIANGTLA